MVILREQRFAQTVTRLVPNLHNQSCHRLKIWPLHLTHQALPGKFLLGTLLYRRPGGLKNPTSGSRSFECDFFPLFSRWFEKWGYRGKYPHVWWKLGDRSYFRADPWGFVCNEDQTHERGFLLPRWCFALPVLPSCRAIHIVTYSVYSWQSVIPLKKNPFSTAHCYTKWSQWVRYCQSRYYCTCAIIVGFLALFTLIVPVVFYSPASVCIYQCTFEIVFYWDAVHVCVTRPVCGVSPSVSPSFTVILEQVGCYPVLINCLDKSQ